MKKIVKIVLFGCVIFITYLVTLYSIQDNLLFHPDTQYKSPVDIGMPVFIENSIKATDGTSIMTWYHQGDQDKPAVLFLHGNTGQIATFAPHLDPIIKSGYSVLMMEYRGFANTEGNISQKVVVQDAVLAFDWLKNKGYTKIIVYGYSFGTAFASALTSEREVDGLILLAPFSSLKKLVSEKPVPFAKFVLKDDYLSVEYLKKYKNPLLLVHGNQDTLIPYHHSQILFDASISDQKSLKLLNNETHSSVFYNEKSIPYILKFLEQFE